MERLRTFVSSAFAKGLAGGVVGLLSLWVLGHLWVDHQTHHVMVECINTRCWEAKPKPAAAAVPTPPPSAPAH